MRLPARSLTVLLHLIMALIELLRVLSHLGTALGKGEREHHPACPPQQRGFRAGGWGEAFQHPFITAGLKTPIISHDSRAK